MTVVKLNEFKLKIKEKKSILKNSQSLSITHQCYHSLINYLSILLLYFFHTRIDFSSSLIDQGSRRFFFLNQFSLENLTEKFIEIIIIRY